MTRYRLPWPRIDRFVAALTAANGMLGLVIWATGPAPRGAIDILLLLALLGLLSGALAWRGHLGGHGAGLVFYGVQLAAFHGYHATQAYRLPWTFSLAFVVHLPAGVLVVNGFAVAMLAASAALLGWRFRTLIPQ